MLWPLVVLLVGAGLVAVVWKTTDQAVAAWAHWADGHIAAERDYQRKLLDLERRKVTVEERRVAVEEKRTERPAAMPPIPDDLAARCEAWDDAFANQQERASLIQLWHEYGDWDTVRQKLVPLQPYLPEGDEIAAPRDGLIQ